MAARRGMEPRDIASLTEAKEPRLSPDARRVAYVVETVDLEENRYRSAVWLQATDGGGTAVRLTAGEWRDAKPRWSPDGERLAFVTTKPDTTRVVQVVGTAGTVDGAHEPRVVLEWPDEVDEVAWSPDGTRLALSARVRDDDRYRFDKAKDQPARRIDRLTYRLDGTGWTIDRPRHVVLVDVDGAGGWSVLTPGPFQDSGVSWSPDGTTIAFSSGRHDTWDRDMGTDVFTVPVDASAEPTCLTETGFTHVGPSFSPDGSRVAFIRGDRRSFPRHGRIGVVSVGGGDERTLTDSLDRNCGPYLLPAREPVWDGDRLVFQVEDAGNIPLYSVPADGSSPPALLVGGDRMITAYDVRDGVLAFVASSPAHGPEVFTVVAGEERRLTSVTQSFVERIDAPQPERFVATSADGTEVEAWLMVPSDFDRDGEATLPLVLNVHGGPYSQYGNRLFDEFLLQTGAGFAVVYSNPRGSSGYSEAFARAIRGPHAEDDPGTGWGGADFDDVMAVVDEALRRFPFLDADRLGIQGGSYGGFMTSWAIGHTDRFRCAISDRALNDMLTMTWTSDIGHYFNAGYVGAIPVDAQDELRRQSPVTYVRDMHTPLLILHSEEDQRCPVSQAEELFTYLTLLDRDVEFWRFPGETHDLSRGGAPKHRIQRAELIREFLSRHLSAPAAASS